MSFGYSIVKLILKLKKVKKSWSQDPIDYVKKRKDDIHVPKKRLVRGKNVKTLKVDKSIVQIINPYTIQKDQVTIYFHGGGFVCGPTKENWQFISKIVSSTNSAGWLVDYPKAPEHTIDIITENAYKVYLEALKSYDGSNIVLIGDSAGGNLILTLVQRLIKEKLTPPAKVIPITPVMDASLTNPKIKEKDAKDLILGIKGVLSANKMCAGSYALTNPIISPLYGSFESFPPIYLFLATDDILAPDQEVFIDILKKNMIPLEVILGNNMPHVWPLLPVMPESKNALGKIVSIINSCRTDG
ncbi:alpha/beta hydrolase fold domain-containing protein [Aquimarina sp. 2201CG14-23]|uniref:alpha/beta hydrolase fold domain-containing protein n=1 Tax=Aquimarina mycalae TaxID=3040073 RepID=UPI002477D66F|nr:alpha/beta hydrolase [Aquimarina sp. 2201CG14-23]MDH7446448.1 alpha/beta hydrolase [Aquimarina sp. 2201CG14-23]